MGEIISAKDIQLEGLSKTLYEIILDQSSDPIFCFNQEGQYLYINMAFAKAFNVMPSDIVGKKIWDIFPGEEGDKRFAVVKKAFETQLEVSIDVKVDAVDGTRYYMTTARPIMDDNSIPRTVICISKEITERKNMEQALKEAKSLAEDKNKSLNMTVNELYFKSITDGLTQLNNRQHTVEMLGKATQLYIKKAYELVLVIIDIDHFKDINDQHGHVVGDDALIEFSKELTDAFEIDGMVGRFGGEEFMIFTKTASLESIADRVDTLRKKVSNTLFTRTNIHFTFSAGIKQYAGEGIDEFINNTDMLMYEAKKNGRNQIKYL